MDIYARVANRLSELINDVRKVWVDRDEKRELYTLNVTDRGGTSHPARALSDGTLRFLALAVLDLDPQSQGVICLEEPENGIHPQRIPAMLTLLRDIATNVDESIGDDNPLRQVIINTHSPAVVMQVPDDSLLVAESKEMVSKGRRFGRVVFSGLPQTWRENVPDALLPVAKGTLISYLNSVPRIVDEEGTISTRQGEKRVADRSDLQLMLPVLK